MFNQILDRLCIKVIAFDVFNTVVRFDTVPYAEKKAYADHIQQPSWSPLVLPDSWRKLPAYPDSREGIRRLRERYKVVACSNGPAEMMADLSAFNKIEWDHIIPLEKYKVFKPHTLAYQALCDELGVSPEDVLFISANLHFGDLEGATARGMQALLIRGFGIPDIITLDMVLKTDPLAVVSS